MKNYVIITSRFVKNNIATEFPVVDLVYRDSQSIVWIKFEK